jgi:hypothetical protein
MSNVPPGHTLPTALKVHDMTRSSIMKMKREAKGSNGQGNALWLLDKKDEVEEEYRRIQPNHAPICCGRNRP